MSVASWLSNGWVEDAGTGLFFLVVGSLLTIYGIVKPQQRRHREDMDAHERHEKTLKGE